MNFLPTRGKPVAQSARHRSMTFHNIAHATISRLLPVVASGPGQRAGTLGLAVFHIIAGIAGIAVVLFIPFLIISGFAWAWEHVPLLIILWGLSGPCSLIVAYIFAIHKLYWIGWIDLGIFLAIWFIAECMNAFDRSP